MPANIKAVCSGFALASLFTLFEYILIGVSPTFPIKPPLINEIFEN